MEVSKKIDVSVEPGCPVDDVVKFNGEGNEIPGAEAGDLLIQITTKKHKLFTRKGADLHIAKEINLKQALLGFSFTIKHLDGKDLLISSIPGEVTEDQTFKVVKGKGMPFYRDTMSHGNLIINFTVKFPKSTDLTEDVKNALDKVLPGPKTGPAPKSTPAEYLFDFSKADLNSSAKGGNTAEDDDEDENGHGEGRHQQRAECGVQ